MTTVRVDHVALWVRDVDAVCAFYATHLGATVGELYVNAAKGFRSRFLSWAGTAVRVEVMHRDGLDSSSSAERSGWAHIALGLGSEPAVDDAAERLHAAGVPVVDGPRRTGDGYYECVILDPEGNRIELTA